MPSGSARSRISVIVATYNEIDTIDDKLRELVGLTYPPDRIDLTVVDGGSTDGTQAVIAAWARTEPRILPIYTTLANKTAQLNEALARTRAPWVCVTDADSRMPADTLQRMMAAALADPTVALVGTPLQPHDPHPLDAWHWRLSNMARRLENRLGTTGLVVAPCYLFRRTLLDAWPDDVTADDVHVACRAALTGARVALVEAPVLELRSAGSSTGWFGHKRRRTASYLREIFRFAPATFRMPYPMRLVFLWRALALTAGPLVGLGALAAGTLALGWPMPAAVAGLAVTAEVVRQVPGYGPTLARPLFAAVLPFWTTAITATAVIGYPLARQTACYAKVPLRRTLREAS